MREVKGSESEREHVRVDAEIRQERSCYPVGSVGRVRGHEPNKAGVP